MFRTITSTMLLSALLVFVTGSAMAAPQVLAVLSTGNGAAMECEGDTCKAILSTYCLQRDRESPIDGTVYHAADPNRYSLVLDFADGSEKVLPLDGKVTFLSSRGFRAVNAIISRSLITEQGAEGARMRVAAEASLIPQADPDDLNPLTEEDIALAVGPLRNLGARVLDSRADADVARSLGTMLRGVPEWRGYPQMEKDELWSKVSQVAAQEKMSAERLERVKREFDSCISVHEAGRSYSVGYCIMQRHDDVIMELNKRYWETQAGS